MITYRKCRTDPLSGTVYTVMRFNDDDSTSAIQFNPANMDYQHFKQQIDDGTGQLQENDGTLMSQDAARAYVSTLPQDK